MKKLTLGLAILLSSYMGETAASLPTGLPRCATRVPSFQGDFTFGLQGLYWRATTPELDYALTFPLTDIGFSSEGVYRSVFDNSYHWGFSANIGYLFNCSGNDLRLSYTHWNNTDNDNFNNIPLIPSLTSTLNAAFSEVIISTEITLTGTIDGIPFTITVPPGTVLFNVEVTNADILTASASSNFNYRSSDIEFGQTAIIGTNMRLRWFGGLRYANLQNSLQVNYAGVTESTIEVPQVPVFVSVSPSVSDLGIVNFVFDVTANFTDSLNQKTKLEGFGPRFGFDASYTLDYGFGLVGGLSTALLIGENDANLTEIFNIDGDALIVTLPPDGTTVVIGGEEADLDSVSPDLIPFENEDQTTLVFPCVRRVVPNLEAYLGIGWSYQFPNCSKSQIDLQIGYKITHYFNAIDRLSAVGAAAPAARTRHIDDVEFEGPYVGVQIIL